MPPPDTSVLPQQAPAPRAPVSDIVFGLAAFVLSLPTLMYPFGRDQGLYYYVAREWVVRGSIPYKDVLDHKTPGIYLVHALAILLFGERQWGIRILELVGVLAFGFVLGSTLERAGKPIRHGMRGMGMFLSAVMYFGFFDFWSTAQSEIWYSGFGICSIWAARRISDTQKAALVAGAFAGLTLLMKPPGFWFLGIAVAVFVVRLREREPSSRAIVRHAAVYAAGAAMLPVLVLGYFGVKGALPAMKDIVVGANAYYVQHEGGAPGTLVEHLVHIFRVFAPLTPLFFLGGAVGLTTAVRARSRDSIERFAISFALVGAATLAVMMQGKFYLLHWGCLTLPLTFLGLSVFEAVAAWRFGHWSRHVAFGVAISAGYVGTAWIENSARVQRDTLDAELKYLRGIYDLRAFNTRFQLGALSFNYAESDDVGKWLKAHTVPADTVTVRGFQPEVYAICGRHHAGRFFWSTFLTNPARAYRREEWLAEDARDRELHPPKYIVTVPWAHDGLDSAEYYESRGYVRVAAFPSFIVIELPPKEVQIP